MRTLIVFLTLAIVGCAKDSRHRDSTASSVTPREMSNSTGEQARVVFAGGCFWCLEANMELTPGVKRAVSGYIGGKAQNANYESLKDSSHREAVMVVYDPNKVTYEELLGVFWRSIDPTDTDGQFVDRGFQYTTAIYYGSEAERQIAEESAAQVAKTLGVERLATQILPLSNFYQAETYHQDYYKKNPKDYKRYKNNSGRPEL